MQNHHFGKYRTRVCLLRQAGRLLSPVYESLQLRCVHGLFQSDYYSHVRRVHWPRKALPSVYQGQTIVSLSLLLASSAKCGKRRVRTSSGRVDVVTVQSGFVFYYLSLACRNRTRFSECDWGGSRCDVGHDPGDIGGVSCGSSRGLLGTTSYAAQTATHYQPHSPKYVSSWTLDG